MKPKISNICLISVLVLGLIGYGFARFAQNVAINTDVDSGKLLWGFVDGTFDSGDLGEDQLGDNEFIPVEFGPDVGSTSGQFIDTDNDGVLDTLKVTIDNAYPSYWNDIYAGVKNYGTIPIALKDVKLTWCDNTYSIEYGLPYLLLSDGTVLSEEEFMDPGTGEYTIPDNAVLYLCWTTSEGILLETKMEGQLAFEVQVLDYADENANYSFTIEPEAEQYNYWEGPEGP